MLTTREINSVFIPESGELWGVHFIYYTLFFRRYVPD